MFRKIVSNLSFSPALVGQLSFYAKRLRKEETTRRLGLIFVVLALVVQSLAVFQPPESANAASGNDFVSGGLGQGANKSLDNFVRPYDANTNHLKDVLNYFGITRPELVSAQYTSWEVGETLSWGFQSKFSYAQGERAVAVTDANRNVVTTTYGRPNKIYYSSPTHRIYGWAGHSQKMGWFAVLQGCGNLATTTVPTPPPPPPPPPPTPPTPPTPPPAVPPTPPPAPANIKQTKEAVNVSQGLVKASTVTAQAGDQIRYTLTVENTGGTASTVKLEDNLTDVLEYSTLIDKGGGTFNDSSKTLTWPSISLDPSGKQSRTFVVKLLDTIPVTSRGQSDPASYDCSMINVFGNDITVKVNCTTPKEIESVVEQLPKTGPTENMIFAGAVLAIVTYFYARTRQVNKEVRLIRRDLNAGTI
jgi:uncharacterized repeat protein (TIGR01451 family)